MRPQCLVLDEATTMLDPQGQREVLETIARLNTQGVTVIHITHGMDEAALFRRVIALADGRVALDGPPEEVFRSVDELKRIRLMLPPVPILADRLRQDGLPLSPSILTVEQLEEALTQLARAGLKPSERVNGAH